MTPAKILLIAIISLVVFFIGIAAASDCGCDAEPDGGWGAPDYSDDPSWGSSLDDLMDDSSSGSSGSSGGSTDAGGTDTGSGSSGSTSDSGSSSSDSGSSSSPSSGSAEEGIIWRMKGDDLFKKGLFNESLAAYEKATDNDPYAYKSWIGTGRVLLAMNNTDGAAAAFRKALHIDPANAEASLLLGDALAAGGSYEDAVTQYLKALALNPNLAGVKEKITLAETGAAMGNVSGEAPPGMTTGIPQTEPPTMVTPALSPETTTQTTDSAVTPKASFPGLEGIMLALVMGSLLVVLRKR
jgi:tetratricopeptide (TPR) repeat protein